MQGPTQRRISFGRDRPGSEARDDLDSTGMSSGIHDLPADVVGSSRGRVRILDLVAFIPSELDRGGLVPVRAPGSGDAHEHDPFARLQSGPQPTGQPRYPGRSRRRRSRPAVRLRSPPTHARPPSRSRPGSMPVCWCRADGCGKLCWMHVGRDERVEDAVRGGRASRDEVDPGGGEC